MTTSMDVIGWKTTPSTEDIMTLFHLFHIDAIPPIPHLHPESGGDVEWVEQDVWIKPKLPCGMGGTRHSLQTEFSKRGRSFDTLHASNLAT